MSWLVVFAPNSKTRPQTHHLLQKKDLVHENWCQRQSIEKFYYQATKLPGSSGYLSFTFFNLWTQEILQKELVKSQSLQLCECLSGKALRKVTRDVLAESPGEVKRMKQKTHCLRRETKGGLLSYFPCCNWDERGSSNLVASTWHQNRLRWLLCSHNDTRHTPTVHGLWSPKVFS